MLHVLRALTAAWILSGCTLAAAGAVGGAFGAVVHTAKQGPLGSTISGSPDANIGAAVVATFAVARNVAAVRPDWSREPRDTMRVQGTAKDSIRLSNVTWVSGRLIAARNDSVAISLTETVSAAGRSAFGGKHVLVIARDDRVAIRVISNRPERINSIFLGALLGMTALIGAAIFVFWLGEKN